MSLHLGIPVNELMARLPERVFVGYMQHAQRYMLPFRRFEAYFAQIAMLIAQTMGGVKNPKLADFMFDSKEEAQEDEPEFEDEAQAAAEYLGLPLFRKQKPDVSETSQPASIWSTTAATADASSEASSERLTDGI